MKELKYLSVLSPNRTLFLDFKLRYRYLKEEEP